MTAAPHLEPQDAHVVCYHRMAENHGLPVTQVFSNSHTASLRMKQLRDLADVNWAKCYTIRGRDDKYVFQWEFQHRTALP